MSVNERGYENWEFANFDGVGKYEIPEIPAVTELPKLDKWIEFDYCNRVTKNRERIGVHFFEPDYKFIRVWNNPQRYLDFINQFGIAMSPDFSMFTDMPRIMQIWNHFRKHWIARYYYEAYNKKMIPTIGWSDESSYDWCFDGEPKHSIVAVSTVGVRRDKEVWDLFLKGYNEMLNRLEPIKVLCLSKGALDLSGDVQYIMWNTWKGEQADGLRW